MRGIREILAGLHELQVEDEDGDVVRLLVGRPVSEEALQSYEARLGGRLPGEFRDLLAFSNGMNLFGLEIMPVEGQEHFSEQGIISFHNWGNGDFDCIALCSSGHPEGAVLFMNHTPNVLVPISPSLGQWLSAVVDELNEKGAVLHPGDYFVRNEGGIYAHVLESLRGIDCELNG